MVNRRLIRDLENDPDIEATYALAVKDIDDDEIGIIPGGDTIGFDVNKIVEGRILRVGDGMVLVDIGFKSEGSIPVDEWDPEDPPPQVGDLVRVLIEDLEDESAQPEDG